MEFAQSVVGAYILSLVDGKRIIEQICKLAQEEHKLSEFAVCRILYQLTSTGPVQIVD